MGVQQDAQSYAERAHLYSSRIGTVWWFVNFFFRVLIVGGMAKDFLGNELMIQYMISLDTRRGQVGSAWWFAVVVGLQKL